MLSLDVSGELLEEPTNAVESQVEGPLQKRPSSHDVPAATATCRGPDTGSHESVVQGRHEREMSAAADVPPERPLLLEEAP